MNEHEPARERFRRACGLSGPIVLECEEAGRSEVARTGHTFDCPFVLVGRDPRSDLVLDDGQVSRRHAFLQAIAGQILVTDLQSRTKVSWPDEPEPRARGWLDRLQSVQIGASRLCWTDPGPGDTQTPGVASRERVSAAIAMESGLSSIPGSEAVPRASLELPIRMGTGPALWPMEEPLAMVGRADECQLVLSDDTISRFHAALVSTPAGLWVVDLLAREGVHVNGQRVRWAWLAEGDTLRLGQFSFFVRYQIPPDRVTRRDVPLEAGASPPEPPGTELVVRRNPGANPRTSLAATPRRRPPPPAGWNPASPPVAFEAAAPFDPAAAAGEWEPALPYPYPSPYPPSPMAMWQQQMQMMESFHKDMILMVEMFVAMHREHLASVRHELDMVQQLTRELSALQARMAQSPGQDSPSPALPGARPSPRPAAGPAPAIERKKPARKLTSQSGPAASRRSEPRPPEPTPGSPPAPHQAPPPREPVPPPNSRPPAADQADIHADLTRRIARLQRERQGYWQRILKTINK